MTEPARGPEKIRVIIPHGLASLASGRYEPEGMKPLSVIEIEVTVARFL